MRVVEIVPEAKDAATILMKREDGAPLDYQAGQFLTFLIPVNGRELRRSYSLSSAPGINPVPAVTVKRVMNGEVSRYLLDHLRVGDTLVSFSPAGRFTLEAGIAEALTEGSTHAADGRGWRSGEGDPGVLQDDRAGAVGAAREFVFIAAGSGMGPVFALLKKALAQEGPQTRVLLISQHHDEESLLFRRQLERLTGEYGRRFRWVNILSTPGMVYSGEPALHRATGAGMQTIRSHFGRLTNFLLEELLEDLSGPDRARPRHTGADQLFYLCGPPAFMRMAQFTLRLMGIADSRIRKENFTVEFVPPAPLLADTTPKRITIHTGGSDHEFFAAWPETILQAGLKHHVPMPYSCRGGRCSSCTARLLKGKIKMSINDVLTEKDMEQGLVLTCVGYAETDLELEY